MTDTQALNVLGTPLEPCSTDPMTGWYRDGCCNTDPGDVGSHTICAVVSHEFLEHQTSIGNNLGRPAPEFGFPGLKPGDRWCVTAANWLRAHMDGVAAPVVLASTHELAAQIVPLDILKRYAVDVPADATLLLGADTEAADDQANGDAASGDAASDEEPRDDASETDDN